MPVPVGAEVPMAVTGTHPEVSVPLPMPVGLEGLVTGYLSKGAGASAYFDAIIFLVPVTGTGDWGINTNTSTSFVEETTKASIPTKICRKFISISNDKILRRLN